MNLYKDYLVKQWLPILTVLAAIVFFMVFHWNYFLFSFQIALGLIAFPVLIKPNSNQTFLLRYLYLSALFLVASWLSHLQVFLFMSWGCFLFFCLEWFWGAIGYLPLFFMACISPALYYVVAIFSFPLRLFLSKVACYLFSLAQWQVQNRGSYFILPSGQEFHIDEACVGLKMFGTGFIAALIVLAFREKKEAKRFSFLGVCLAMTSMLMLLILCNFIRILSLVLFHSMPGSMSHELIGIISLAVYALIPFYFISKFIPLKESVVKGLVLSSSYHKKYIPLLLLVCFIVTTYYLGLLRTQSKRDLALEQLNLPGFSKKEKEDGVMEFKNDSVLLYIKPAIQAFEGGHPPQICWRASGFELANFSEQKIGSYSFMMGTLKKDSHIHYTAWWYDNGIQKTAQEWEWRRHAANPFRVVNVNALDSAVLLREVSYYLNHSVILSK
ncbi:MAG: exosortase N [Bacteroidetes bacterium B1(2017)]|nr:MAG: exosortase N [Bacteroidetes bacterium B1(2017)]